MKIKKIIKNVINYLRTKEEIPIIKYVDESKCFENKTVLILGGTGGIGFEIAKEFLENGANIIIAGSNEKSVNEKLLYFDNSLKCRIKGIIIDLNDIHSFASKISEAKQYFGTIDIFISSAGVHTENVDFWKIDSNEFDRVININLKSNYFIAREVANYMILNNIKGNILFISSSRGSEPAWTPYGISKWGLNGMIQGLAKILLPKGIAVNCIAPGSTATKLINYEDGHSIETQENELNRLILPHEVAELVKCIVKWGGVLSGETIRFSAGRGIFDVR